MNNKKILTIEKLDLYAEINDVLKADKDVEAVLGNLAMFDEEGNPIDSGKRASEVITDNATTQAAGLMSAEDKTKLENINSDLYGPVALVDLGLPSGLLWATCNLGAANPGDYGLYYSWGNIEGHAENSGYDFSDENYQTTPGYSLTGDIPANTTYDAARAALGGDFRMPTKDEFQELYDNCTSVWTTMNGVAGWLFTSNVNGNTLFFPASGFRYGTGLLDHGSYGYYWSSSLNSSAYGYLLFFSSGGVNPASSYGRFLGFSVRAVTISDHSMKTKLDGIEEGAQVHRAPTAAEVKSALGTSSGTTKFLREDGTWSTPSNIIGEFSDEAEFVYRTTAGSLDIESGYKVNYGGHLESIKGNTVAWNQLVPNEYRNYQNIETDNRDLFDFRIVWFNDDTYLQSIYLDNTIGKNSYILTAYENSNSFIIKHNGSDYDINIIPNGTISVTDGHVYLYSVNIVSKDPTTVGGLVINDNNFIDLTLIYGAGNEPTTVATFEADYKRWFGKPLSYEEYDEGSLRPVLMQSVKTTGFNQWDEEWEVGSISSDGNNMSGSSIRAKNFCSALPNTQYFVNDPADIYVIYFYDANKQIIPYTGAGAYQNGYNGGAWVFTTPVNARYFRFRTAADYGTTYNHDICINLHHSGARNGEYEPYWESMLNVPVTTMKGKLNGEGNSVVVFPDGLKKAGSVYDEIVKRGTKTIGIKRVGSVDLGTLGWVKDSTTNQGETIHAGFAQLDNCKIVGQTVIPNMVCDKYSKVDTFINVDYGINGKSICGADNNSRIWIYDPEHNTTDATEFTNMLSGVKLYYELASPEEYILDDFELPVHYKVDDYGTEEVVPVENQVTVAPTLSLKYGINVGDTIKNLPHSYISSIGDQNFTETQKARARKNISAASNQELENTKELLAALAQQLEAEETFTLEGSSSPVFTVSDDSIAKRYISKMGGYGVITKGGKTYAAKLNASVWDRFADDTLISAFPNGAADFETMVRVPDCYFKGENKTLHFGGLFPVENGSKFDSPNWVGAYKMYVDGSGVGHSRPDVAPSHSRTMSLFWSCAQGKGTEWGLANYQFHCLINALFQARYGNLNSQEVIGDGGQTSAWDSWRNVAMGLTKELGDGSGKVLYNDATVGNQYEVKLFGFEGLWGKLWEFRPGIRFYMDDGVRKAVVYDGNIVSNTAEGRVIENILQSAGGEYQTQKTLGEYWDALPKAVGGGSTTYYCDGYWASTGGELLLVGGLANYGVRCGLSFSISYDGFGYAYDSIGARLAFYGNPIIVSGAELLSLVR